MTTCTSINLFLYYSLVRLIPKCLYQFVMEDLSIVSSIIHTGTTTVQCTLSFVGCQLYTFRYINYPNGMHLSYTYSGTSLIRTLWNKDTSVIRTLWNKDTSIIRTISGVPKVAIVYKTTTDIRHLFIQDTSACPKLPMVSMCNRAVIDSGYISCKYN